MNSLGHISTLLLSSTQLQLLLPRFLTQFRRRLVDSQLLPLFLQLLEGFLVLRILLGFLHIFLDLRHHVLDEAEAPGARGLCWL